MNPIFWPLLVAGLFYIFCLCFNAYQHGKPREGKHSFWVSLKSVMISILWIFWLLKAGDLV